MDFQPNQQKVFAAAKKKMEKVSWYKGVCVDNFPSEEDCIRDFEESVFMVTMETEMWDNYAFYA